MLDCGGTRRLVQQLQQFPDLRHYADAAEELDIAERLERAKVRLAKVQAPAYVDSLIGTQGADPMQPAREYLAQEMRRVA